MRWEKILPLKGDIKEIEAPYLDENTWFGGEFQKQVDPYLRQEFGYRNLLLRGQNELDYSLFGQLNARNTILGKEGFLYEKNYIDAYTGKDFLGTPALAKKVGKMKEVQEQLEASGKDFLVMLAAGKASFFPEFIPGHYGKESDSTNYKTYASELTKQEVNFIDFNSWFLSIKGKTEYPIYPKTGIHWTRYAMAMVADSILHRVEKMRDIDLPDLDYSEVEFVDEVRSTDKDIEDGINKLFPIDNWKYAYANVKIDSVGKDRPSMLIISDSFYWGLYSMGISDKVFKDGQFWYYNYAVFPRHFKDKEWIYEKVNLKEEIEKHDIIMLMSTEGNLARFPYGFIEDAYMVLTCEESYHDKKRLEKAQKIMDDMRNDAKWLKHLKEKAKEKNLPLDTVMLRDALFMLEEE